MKKKDKMIQATIKKTMKGAIKNLSQKEAISLTRISIFIHTKSEDCTPMYMYAVDGKVKTNESGSRLDLDFNKDILAVKFDLMGREAIAEAFLKSYFKNNAENLQIPSSHIYIRIDSIDENLSELALGLYNRSELVKSLTMDDIVGE